MNNEYLFLGPFITPFSTKVIGSAAFSIRSIAAWSCSGVNAGVTGMLHGPPMAAGKMPQDARGFPTWTEGKRWR